MASDTDLPRERASSARAYSQAIEDYVKAIYVLGEHGDDVRGTAIADRLGVSPASVTAMLQKLSGLELAVYEKYQPVTLTERGRAVALEVVRHHRLLELFLHDTLGMPWHEIRDEAEVLEHHISERLEQRIAERLGDPKFDPHGDPIPSIDGTVPTRDDVETLTELLPGDAATVSRVTVYDSDRLRYLDSIGIRPGEVITVESLAPFEGPISFSNEAGDTDVLAWELAAHVEVTRT